MCDATFRPAGGLADVIPVDFVMEAINLRFGNMNVAEDESSETSANDDGMQQPEG
jgi:hypothetical protein